jgi:hypothetical protein
MGSIWTYIFSYRIWLDVRTPFYRVGGEMWVECLLQNHAVGINDPAQDPRADASMISAEYYNAGGGRPQGGCGDSFPAFLHVNFARAVAALCAAQGALLFVTFCNGSTLHLWWGAIEAARGKAKNRSQSRKMEKARAKAAKSENKVGKRRFGKLKEDGSKGAAWVNTGGPKTQHSRVPRPSATSTPDDTPDLYTSTESTHEI